jgi:hypothetical protein
MSKSRSPIDARHQTQTFWQIIVPTLLALLLVVAIGVLVILASSAPGGGSTRQWADISIILLLLPVIILSLTCLVITIAAIFAVSWITKKVPLAATLGLLFLLRIQIKVERFSKVVTKPVIQVRSAYSGGQVILSKFHRRLSKHSAIEKRLKD